MSKRTRERSKARQKTKIRFTARVDAKIRQLRGRLQRKHSILSVMSGISGTSASASSETTTTTTHHKFDSCRDSFGCLFYRRPPPVVFRGESQPPPLKLLGATSVSVRMNFPMSYSPAYEGF
ncbi:hypothetical protein YC2023_067923 [Brassica napus]